MLCKNFELILIKIGFFMNFLRVFKVTQKSGQRHCTIVQGLWSNFAKNG